MAGTTVVVVTTEEVTLPTRQSVMVGVHKVTVKVLVRIMVEVIDPESESEPEPEDPEPDPDEPLLDPGLAPDPFEPAPEEMTVVGVAPAVTGQMVVYKATTSVVTRPTGQSMTVAAHEVMVYVCVEYTVLVVNCETDAALTDVALETGNTVVATGTSVDVLLPTGQLATSGAHDVIVYTCIEKMVTVASCTSPLAAVVVPARLAEVITLPEPAPSIGEEAVKLSPAWEPELAPSLGIETELEPAVGSNPEPVEPLEGLVTGTKVGDGTLLSFSSSQISSFSSPSSSSSS